MKRILLVVLVAALVALAGCSGATPGDGANGDDTPAATDGGTTPGDTGTVHFYVSDQPAAIEDFQHLNVTITSIGFQQAGGGDDEAGNETEDGDADDADGEDDTDANETTETPDGDTPTNETEADDDAGDESETEDADGDEDDGESGGWIEVDVENRTVDLTRLQGDNASLVGSTDLPAGTYTKVFVHVGEVQGTLTDGTEVNVKLPSEKLQLNKGFELAPNGTISFVYDINVVKAGNSGKYILKPVISESGPDKPINDVDADDEDGEDEEDDTESDGRDEDDDGGDAEDAERADDRNGAGDGGGPAEATPTPS